MKARLMAGGLAVVVAVSFSWAQEFTTSVGAGSKAMLFTFSGLTYLGAGAYNGGFGGKFYLSPALALRASLMFGYANQTVKTTLANGGKDGSLSAMEIGASGGVEYHLSFARVSPFIGGVLNFSTASTTNALPVNVVGGNEVTVDNGATILGIAPGTALSVGGIAGVEFFVTKELSLSAEYQLGFGFPMGYTQTTKTVTGTGSTEVKVDVEGTSRLGIENTGALTLSVYF